MLPGVFAGASPGQPGSFILHTPMLLYRKFLGTSWGLIFDIDPCCRKLLINTVLRSLFEYTMYIVKKESGFGSSQEI